MADAAHSLPWHVHAAAGCNGTSRLPDIQDDLKASFSSLQWVVDAYALTLAALLLTAGSLADMFGRRRLYVIGLGLFTVASLLCGLAQTVLMLQLSRALQGVGGAIMFSVSLALLADAFRGKDRGVAFGVWGAVTGLAVAVGPLLGGALTSGLSWRWIFFVNLPIGIAAVVLTLAKVAESKSPDARRPDWLGFVLFTTALASLVYGLIESNERTFSSGLVIGALVGAALLLVAFIATELRSSAPMFDLSLFKLPTFTGGAVAAFGMSATIFALLLYLVLYLQDVLQFSALQTGLRLLVLSGGILATSTVAGRAHVPRAGAVPDRSGAAAGRYRTTAHARPRCRLSVDPSGARPDRLWRGRRAGEPTTGLDRHRRRRPRPRRDGFGDQLHIPAGRDRDRHRLAGNIVHQRGHLGGARSDEPDFVTGPDGPHHRQRRAVRGDRSAVEDIAHLGPQSGRTHHDQCLRHRPEPDPAGRGRRRAQLRRCRARHDPSQRLQPADAGHLLTNPAARETTSSDNAEHPRSSGPGPTKPSTRWSIRTVELLSSRRGACCRDSSLGLTLHLHPGKFRCCDAFPANCPSPMPEIHLTVLAGATTCCQQLDIDEQETRSNLLFEPNQRGPTDVATGRVLVRAHKSSRLLSVRGNLPFVQAYESVLDALGDRTRRVIIEELRAGPATVRDLAERIPVSRPAISQHLKVLQTCRLVDYDPIGTRHLYRLDPAGLQQVRSWLNDFWGEVLEQFVSYATDHAEVRAAEQHADIPGGET